MKKRVLMMGSVLSVKGGMTSVVNNFLSNCFSEFEIDYFPTHHNRGALNDIILFALKAPLMILKMVKAEIIHLHMSERGSCIRKYICFKIARIMKKKIIVHMHGAEFKEYYEACNKGMQTRILNMLVNADYVIVLGENWEKYVKGLSPKINTVILKNTVAKSNSIVLRNEKIFNILFMAIIDKRKGIHDLVEAAYLIVKNLPDKRLKFIIAGTGNDEIEIKKRVKELNLNSYFEFTGWITSVEKDKVLKQSHLLVLPSYNEGLPVSIVEAMSYAIPIVSTNVGSIDEAVFNGENGYLLKPGDVNNLYNSIREMIENEELWNSFSQKSLDIFNQYFDNNQYFNKVEQLYKGEL